MKLSFDSFDLESVGWGQCDEDYVEVLDVKYNNSLSIGRFCDSTPSDIHSSGRYMRVRFKSDSESTDFSHRGFKASFIAEDGLSTCRSKCSLQLENTVYYLSTSEIPSERSRENFISSHVKRSPSLWLHNKSRLLTGVYIVNKILHARLWI